MRFLLIHNKILSGNSGEFKSCYIYDTDIIISEKIDEKSKGNFSMLVSYAICNLTRWNDG